MEAAPASLAGAAAADTEQASASWILDSGAGYHLAGEDLLSAPLLANLSQDEKCIKLATANGVVESQGTVRVYIPELETEADLLVMHNCPAVLSMGRLIEDDGYRFTWHSGEAVLTSPSGARLRCEVQNYVPSLKAGSISTVAACAGVLQLPCALPGVREALPDEPSDPEQDERPPEDAPGEAQDAEQPAPPPPADGDPLPDGGAESIFHMMTHTPKRDDCLACMEAKVKAKYAKRKSPQLDDDPKGWGHTLLADHYVVGELGLGIEDERYGLLLKDLGTSFLGNFAVTDKTTNATIMMIREFGGPDTQWTYMASDNARELVGAAKYENMLHLPSTPWRPTSNSLIEREVGLLSGGTRALLAKSGLSHLWWPHAAKCYVHARNVVPRAPGEATPWHDRFGEKWHGPLFPFGCMVVYRPPDPYKSRQKFAPRGRKGIFLSYFLLPGNIWKGDFVVADLEEMVNNIDGKIRTFRIKEARLPPQGIEFPLREARDRVLTRQTDEAVAGGGMDEQYEVEIAGADDEMDQEAIEDAPRSEAIENVEPPAGQPSSSTELMRVPRGSRIYIPRVGPPAPPPPKRSVNYPDYTTIEFIQDNPKQIGSKSRELYEAYKTAKTIGEARAAGATRGHIRYDISKGFAKIAPEGLVVVMAATALRAPLLEGWCAPDSALGRTGERCGRRVLRFTEKEDLGKPETVDAAAREVRKNPGCHLHGSLPCTPWSAWQSMNLAKASDVAKEKIRKAREKSLEFVVSFKRIAKIALAGGGSVSFEWPRYCSGWKQPEVMNMIEELQLTAVDVDGCSVGVVRKADGQPMLKPWRFMVSSPHLVEQLQGFRCQGGHQHAPCSGPDTARSAFYPEELCRAVHKGLDEHERNAKGYQATDVDVRPAGVVHDVCRSEIEPGVVHDVCRSTPEELTGPAETSGGQGHDAAEASGGPAVTAHRLRVDPSNFGLWSGLVTRIVPAGTPEFKSAPCARALKKERSTLMAQDVWDEKDPHEWADVRRADPRAMCGRVFAIMGEKAAERNLPPDQRDYKARVVFAGNAIQTSSGVPAHELFQEVSQAPAAMATVRCLLAAAALRGWTPKVRDAAQAYIQSRIDSGDRPSTWVRLPKSWWPATWYDKGGAALFNDPVVRLHKALYGHPEAGALWDKHLRDILIALGWTALDSHPGFWTHARSRALLAVYVDDLLMAASPEDEDRLWQELESKVTFGEPASAIAKFLGAHHRVTRDKDIVTYECQMRDFLLDAAEKFMEETGATHLAFARTPYLPDDFDPKADATPGVHAGTASSHLMKLLYAARVCRPDLTVGITRLAAKVTSWNTSHDRALKRLMQYCHHNANLMLTGCLSVKDINDAIVVMSPDADLAGDMETAKSTSGLWLEMRSSCGMRAWPLSWKSKKQGSTASSTCEAEYISMASGAKQEAIPAQLFMESALGRTVGLRCLEDNTQCIAAVRNGYSAALRSLPRTERIALSVAHEVFVETPENALVYEETSLHRGDMFTKRLAAPAFEDALARIGMRRMV